MMRRVEALNFRCLKYVSQPMRGFHVLVGPNASGKSTFLDVVAFLGQLVSEGLEATVETRTRNFHDLVWQRSGEKFELAAEFSIPEERQRLLPKNGYSAVRYEVQIGLDDETKAVSILAEKVLLEPADPEAPRPQRQLFPEEMAPPAGGTLISPTRRRKYKTVVNKFPGGNDNYNDEIGKGWGHSFRLGPRRSALGNLPEDESLFPVATWLKGILIEGIQRLVLNSARMRDPSPPGQPKHFRPDGSNLPWVIDSLSRENPEHFTQWISHLKTALPDLVGIRTVERPEDKNRYLMVQYASGLEVPSWMVSDGTLRLLALTLPAYLPGLRGVYLIEEPENGIHPRAVETMFQSLSSVYDAQILLATHSPVILSLADAQTVLCFAKTLDGATDIVIGSEHPALRQWRRETSLGTLFAAGVLG